MTYVMLLTICYAARHFLVTNIPFGKTSHYHGVGRNYSHTSDHSACQSSPTNVIVKGVLHHENTEDILTINGGCSLYVPVRSEFEAAVSITRAI